MVDVVIVGAGPAGLTLAAELALRNISCVVLEKRIEDAKISRAFSLAPYTLELFAMRGVAQSMIERGRPCYFAPLSDGRSHLDLSSIPSQFNYLLTLPQVKTNQVLEKWAVDCGAIIMRGAELINLKQHKDHVEVVFLRHDRYCILNAKYVIGCDGINSAVRKIAHIDYIGCTVEKSLMHGDVFLSTPPENPVFAKTSRHGMVATIPFKDNLFRILVIDQDRMNVPLEHKLTIEELSNSVKRITGRDFGISSAHWLQRFRGQQKHASTYRQERVLLCGDAAHSHLPAGGQGLQMCIQDAFNLGWKLAATISGIASETILDSYVTERRPMIEAAMKHSLRMFHYETSFSGLSVASMRVLNNLLRIPLFSKWVISKISGLDTRYQIDGASFSNSIGMIFDNDIVKDSKRRPIRLAQALQSGKPTFVSNADQVIHFHNEPNIMKHFTLAINEVGSATYSHKNILIRPDGLIADEVKRWNPENIRSAAKKCFDQL